MVYDCFTPGGRVLVCMKPQYTDALIAINGHPMDSHYFFPPQRFWRSRNDWICGTQIDLDLGWKVNSGSRSSTCCWLVNLPRCFYYSGWGSIRRFVVPNMIRPPLGKFSCQHWTSQPLSAREGHPQKYETVMNEWSWKCYSLVGQPWVY